MMKIKFKITKDILPKIKVIAKVLVNLTQPKPHLNPNLTQPNLNLI